MQDTELARHTPSEGWMVVMVAGSDERVAEAIELEADAMAELGDFREEVLAEFAPVNEHSLFLLLFPSASAFEMSSCHGVARFVPTTETHGNKTLNDVAHLTVGPDDVDAVRAVEAAFLDQSGCEDIRYSWDIATFAFPVTLPHKARIAASIEMFTTVGHMLRLAMDHASISHVTSFNQVDFHNYLTGTIGVPFSNLSNSDGIEYGELKYDTFDSGEAMVAVPAWSALAVLLDHVFDPTRADEGTLAYQVAAKTATAAQPELLVSAEDFRIAARPSPTV